MCSFPSKPNSELVHLNSPPKQVNFATLPKIQDTKILTQHSQRLIPAQFIQEFFNPGVMHRVTGVTELHTWGLWEFIDENWFTSVTRVLGVVGFYIWVLTRVIHIKKVQIYEILIISWSISASEHENHHLVLQIKKNLLLWSTKTSWISFLYNSKPVCPHLCLVLNSFFLAGILMKIH